jgi:hypothetical protein
MEDDEDVPTLEIIRPTAREASEGYRKLQTFWPTWKQTPALLVSSENDLGLIVSAVEYAHDELGFVLHFAVADKLFAPSDFDDEEYSVGFGWNQPYLSFDQDHISAPYAYYLHFEHAGVERARELSEVLRDNKDLEKIFGPRSLRRCFGPDGEEYVAEMMFRYKE